MSYSFLALFQIDEIRIEFQANNQVLHFFTETYKFENVRPIKCHIAQLVSFRKRLQEDFIFFSFFLQSFLILV